jgi:dTDP-glucose pyrophosphorylase
VNFMTISTIILCAGKVDISNLPIGTNISNATIPVNGKPVIAWILDDLIRKGFRENIHVVVRSEDKKLQMLLLHVYAKKAGVNCIPLVEPSSILVSLWAGLSSLSDEGAVQIILGDTLIRDDFECKQNMVYVGEVDDSKRWCLALMDEHGELTDLIDKKENQYLSKQALAGYYFFTDTSLLKSAVKQSLESGEKELSAAIRLYMKEKPIQTRHAKEWYDFGHIDNLLNAKRNLMRPRYFNQLEINPVLNTIKKNSENTEKLRDELDWYLQIPDELKALTPRILHYETQGNQVEITQEYYGYPTLSEIYVYSDLHPENWMIILRHLIRIHEQFCKYKVVMPSDTLVDMYITKTEKRLTSLMQSQYWSNLLNRKEVIYNGKIYQNFGLLRPFIETVVEEMKQDFSPCIIHGDFCFSNILYDFANQIVRLIDPRGSFGVKGIYGDPRYDMAKLRHSVAGMYDFIVSDLFDVRESEDGFQGEIFNMQNLSPVIENFDQKLLENGYNVQHIKLIEGLLFISMLPLHQDYPKRQLMMFLTGIVRLNEVKEFYMLQQESQLQKPYTV